MDITEDIFVNRLRILKAATPLRQFGAKIGVCEGTVRNYLQGKTKPKMGILQNISKEYNVSLEWLLEGEMSSSQKPVERIVAETRPPYGEKLPPEEEKFIEIKAYMETIQAAGPPAQALFNEKFIECFKSFEIWSKRRCSATAIDKDEEE